MAMLGSPFRACSSTAWASIWNDRNKNSVILGRDLKVSLGMGADGADLRGGGADDDVTAVAALPHLHLALLELEPVFTTV